MSARQTILNQVMRFADPADMDVGNWDICTDNILKALGERGFAIVPVDPTQEMCDAGFSSMENEDGPATVWGAMLKAREDSRE